MPEQCLVMDEKHGASFNLCRKCAALDGKRDWETAFPSWGDNVGVSARLVNDCGKKQRHEVSEPILIDNTQDTVPYIDTYPFIHSCESCGIGKVIVL